MAFVLHLTDTPLGCQNALLSQPLLRHPLVKTFLSDAGEIPCLDNRCLCRANAFEKFGSDGLAASTQFLVTEPF